MPASNLSRKRKANNDIKDDIPGRLAETAGQKSQKVTDTTSQDEQKQCSTLPATVWGSILNFMPYKEVRSALLVSKLIASDAVKHVETLTIFYPKELDVVAARRFANATDVRVCCLVRCYYVLDSSGSCILLQTVRKSVVGHAVPFLLTFPRLERVFVGGYRLLLTRAELTKSKFLMLAKILMKYLEREDSDMHAKAKAAYSSCKDRRLVSLEKRLREVVGETHWKEANSYLQKFWKSKGQTPLGPIGSAAKKASIRLEAFSPRKSASQGDRGKDLASFRTLITSLCDAFRIRALSSCLVLKGVCDAVSGMQHSCNPLSAEEGHPCSLCRAICSTFPLKTALRLRRSATCSQAYGITMTVKDYYDIVKARPGGQELLFTNTSRMQHLLSDGVEVGARISIDPEASDKMREIPIRMGLEGFNNVVYVLFFRSEELDEVEHLIRCGFDQKQLSNTFICNTIRHKIERMGHKTKDTKFLMVKTSFDRLVSIGVPIDEKHFVTVIDKEFQKKNISQILRSCTTENGLIPRSLKQHSVAVLERLLELDNSEIFHLMGNIPALRSKVREVLQHLEAHRVAQEQTGD